MADFISRLPTYIETTISSDSSIPCLTVEDEERPLDDVDLDDFYDDFVIQRCSLVADVEEFTDIAPITLAELVQAQSEDSYCRGVRDRLQRGEGLPSSFPFQENYKGLLVRISPVDKSEQTIVPQSLRPNVLYMCHHPRMAGHPGGSRIFQAMRRTYYWPSMALDVYAYVRDFEHRAKERLALRKHSNYLKLFPASQPLAHVAIDILAPLARTTHGNRYLLEISDRFSKLTKAVPLRRITSYTMPRPSATTGPLVMDHQSVYFQIMDDSSRRSSSEKPARGWAFATYSLPRIIRRRMDRLSDSSRTTLAELRRFTSEDQRHWDVFSNAVTFAYNTQCHASTGYSPFELQFETSGCGGRDNTMVSSRPPHPLAVKQTPAVVIQGENPHQVRQRVIQKNR